MENRLPFTDDVMVVLVRKSQFKAQFSVGPTVIICVWKPESSLGLLGQKASEYDQEIPQSHTA